MAIPVIEQYTDCVRYVCPHCHTEIYEKHVGYDNASDAMTHRDCGGHIAFPSHESEIDPQWLAALFGEGKPQKGESNGRRVKGVVKNRHGNDREEVFDDGDQVLNDNLEESLTTGSIAAPMASFPGTTKFRNNANGEGNMANKQHKMNQPGKPIGGRSMSNEKTGAHDTNTRDMGKEWPRKQKNSGGQFEKMEGGGHDGNMSEHLTPADIADTIYDDGVTLQNLFNSYANGVNYVSLREFNEIAHAYGCLCQDERMLIQLMEANHDIMFIEGEDGQGRYWVTQLIDEGELPPSLKKHQFKSKGKKQEEGGTEENDDSSGFMDDTKEEGRRRPGKPIGENRKRGRTLNERYHGDEFDDDFGHMHHHGGSEFGGEEFGGGMDEFGDEEFGGGMEFDGGEEHGGMGEFGDEEFGGNEFGGEFSGEEFGGEGELERCPECGMDMDELGCPACGYAGTDGQDIGPMDGGDEFGGDEFGDDYDENLGTEYPDDPDFIRPDGEGDFYEGADADDESLLSEKNWIQGAINPKHKGYCTPMSKKTCTPRRKALAKRFKKGGDLHDDHTQQGRSIYEHDGKVIDGPLGSGVEPHPGKSGGKKSGLPETDTNTREMGKEWPRRIKNTGSAQENFGNSKHGTPTGGEGGEGNSLSDHGEAWPRKQKNSGQQWEELSGGQHDGKMTGGTKKMYESVKLLERHVCKTLSEYARASKLASKDGRYPMRFVISAGSFVKPSMYNQLSEALVDAEELVQVFGPEAVSFEAQFCNSDGSLALKRLVPMINIPKRGPIVQESANGGQLLFRFPEVARDYADLIVKEGKACRAVTHNWGAAVSAKINYAGASKIFRTLQESRRR